MLELIKQRRGDKWEEWRKLEAGEQSDEEMGEEELSEAEAEEGEAEMESSDSDAPELVPADPAAINNETGDQSSSISDLDVDDYGSSSDDYDSDELDPDSTANPHGFVYSNMLDTYKKSRQDRIKDMRENFDKDEHRQKFKKKKESKRIGKS